MNAKWRCIGAAVLLSVCVALAVFNTTTPSPTRNDQKTNVPQRPGPKSDPIASSFAERLDLEQVVTSIRTDGLIVEHGLLAKTHDGQSLTFNVTSNPDVIAAFLGEMRDRLEARLRTFLPMVEVHKSDWPEFVGAPAILGYHYRREEAGNVFNGDIMVKIEKSLKPQADTDRVVESTDGTSILDPEGESETNEDNTLGRPSVSPDNFKLTIYVHETERRQRSESK